MSTDSHTVSTHTADYIPAAVCFTIITAPQTITKTYAKDAAGQLVSKAAAAVGRSVGRQVGAPAVPNGRAGAPSSRPVGMHQAPPCLDPRSHPFPDRVRRPDGQQTALL